MTGIEFGIWGLSGAVVVDLLVTLCKSLWPDVFKDRAAVALGIGVGVLLSVVAYLSTIYPIIETISQVAGAGLLAGMAAGGLYSAVKTRA